MHIGFVHYVAAHNAEKHARPLIQAQCYPDAIPDRADYGLDSNRHPTGAVRDPGVIATGSAAHAVRGDEFLQAQPALFRGAQPVNLIFSYLPLI